MDTLIRISVLIESIVTHDRMVMFQQLQAKWFTFPTCTVQLARSITKPTFITTSSPPLLPSPSSPLPRPQAKPSHCERATEEINLVAQKLITSSEGDLQLSYAKQRRTKSSALLHKELDARSNRAVRQYLVKV